MSKFLKGFIFGSVIGGAVALLNNPRSGKENREILAQQIQEVTQDVTVINTGKSTLERGIKDNPRSDCSTNNGSCEFYSRRSRKIPIGKQTTLQTYSR